MAKKKTRVNPRILKDLVDHMNGPAGGGDMYKSVYDTDNDAKVDQAEEADTLDGQHASAFAGASHTHPGGDVTSQVGDAHTVDGSHAADFAAASKGVTNGDSHDHAGGDGAAIAEGALSLSDVATGDVDATKHGFAPKAPNDTTKFLRGDGTWAAPGSSGGLGLVLNLLALNYTPTDGETIFWGGLCAAPSTTAACARVYVPKSGTIKIAYIFLYCGTGGSAEAISVYIRLNNSTDTLVATVTAGQTMRVFSNTGLSIAVSQGDYFEIKVVCPTWNVNPALAKWGGVVYME